MKSLPPHSSMEALGSRAERSISRVEMSQIAIRVALIVEKKLEDRLISPAARRHARGQAEVAAISTNLLFADMPHFISAVITTFQYPCGPLMSTSVGTWLGCLSGIRREYRWTRTGLRLESPRGMTDAFSIPSTVTSTRNPRRSTE